jgi:hypothetical protein
MKTATLFFVIISISFNLFSQKSKKARISLDDKHESYLVDSLYGENTWNNYFRYRKTKYAHFIQLKLVDDSSYYIRWGNSLKQKTFPIKFNLDGHESWIPRLVYENNDYLVLNQSCGSPCWIGYFLPLNDEVKPQIFNEYLDFDLKNHLVAYVNKHSELEITNLQTQKKQIFKIPCSSAFLGYCIENITLKNKKLKYKLNTDPGNKSSIISVTEKIKI